MSRQEKTYNIKRLNEKELKMKLYNSKNGVCARSENIQHETIDITSLEGAELLFQIKEELSHKEKGERVMKGAIRVEEKVNLLESEDKKVKVIFDDPEIEEMILKSDKRIMVLQNEIKNYTR